MSKKLSTKTDFIKSEIDPQTNIKMLSYTINVKEAEIAQQSEYINELTFRMSQLEKEHEELKANYLQTFKTEKTIKQMQILLEQEQRDVERYKEELKNIAKEYKDEKDELIKKYESELSVLRNMMELQQKKIENVHNLQNLVEKQEEEIKHLTLQRDNTVKDCESNIRSKDIKNQIKFSDLKKKMMQSIQETQKNVTELNIEYMDVSTKLTLLQNHQLLVEIQYQSEQIEELLKKKEFLEKKIFELNKDLEVHREVELSLAEKNKSYSEIISNMEKKLKSSQEKGLNLYSNEDKNNIPKSQNYNTCHDIHSLNNISNREDSIQASKSIYLNPNIKEFTISLDLEKKISKLENVLKKKQEELKKMKDNYLIIEEKFKSYERKLGGFYCLLEEGMKSLGEDEELKINNNQSMEINFEKLKGGNVSNFTKEEKYFVIDLIMKNIIPLLDFSNDNKSFNEINQTSPYKSNSEILKKHLDDPVMKIVFSSNNNNMLYSVKRGLEKLPLINKNRTKTNYSSYIF